MSSFVPENWPGGSRQHSRSGFNYKCLFPLSSNAIWLESGDRESPLWRGSVQLTKARNLTGAHVATKERQISMERQRNLLQERINNGINIAYDQEPKRH